MAASNLWNALSYPSSEDQIRCPKRVILEQLAREFTQNDLSKKGMIGYLTVRSEFPVQSYAQRVDWSTKEMGTPILPPGIKETKRTAAPNLVMQGKGRKV